MNMGRVCGLLVLLVMSWFPPVLSAADRPNILWITIEDMSSSLVFGDGVARTPAIDGLAREGVRYRNAFASAPVCSPARACLITGVHATSMGNAPLRCQMPLPREFRGYAARLRDAGYFTTNNVKTDYNIAGEAAFIKDCWDQCSAQAHWRARKPGQPFMSVFNLMQTHQSRINVDSWDSFEQMARANLRPEERTDPAKVLIPPYYPDTPMVRRTLARTSDCISAVDKHVARILRELEQDGLAEDTVVFFYGDNGTGLPRGKRTLYDSGLRVPLIIRFPKKYQHLAPAGPGGSADRLVSFVDFAPTVLSLAGLEIPTHMQGTAFLGKAAGAPREYVYGARDRVDEAYDLSRSVSDGRWLYIRNYFPHISHLQPEGYSDQADIRRELRELASQGKLNEVQLTYAGARKPLEELFDCQADPHNVTNLADRPEQAQRVRGMRLALRNLIRSTRDVNFVPEEQLRVQSKGRTPYEFARDSKSYNLEDILAAAELVGQKDALNQQLDLLRSDNPTVRYWAAVGMRAARLLHRESIDPAALARCQQALTTTLKDESASVRIEAAAALLADTDSAEALAVLTTALKDQNLEAALHAARTLQLLGSRAGEALADMQAALVASRTSRDPDHALYFRFALEPAIGGLGGKVPPR